MLWGVSFKGQVYYAIIFFYLNEFVLRRRPYGASASINKRQMASPEMKFIPI